MPQFDPYLKEKRDNEKIRDFKHSLYVIACTIISTLLAKYVLPLL